VSVQQIHPEVETQPTDPSTMRVPQGVLEAAADLGGDNFRRIDPAVVTSGVFPIAEDIEHWRIVPREGTPLALVLPFPGSSGITVQNLRRQLSVGDEAQKQEMRAALRGRAGHEARLVLCGNVLMSYLTTWALWATNPDPAGRFLVTTGKVADLRGFRLYGERGKETYGKPMSSFKRDLLSLMNCGVVGTTEIKARTAEPMIQLYEIVRGGTYYRHAPLLVDTIMLKAGEAGGFAQVPMRAIRLSAYDARTVVGLAALWRPLAAATAWRGTLQELAQQLGILRATTLRTLGRAYWVELARNVARVADEGGFGRLFVEGVDPRAKTTVVLTPSPELADAYQRLRDARERARTKADVVAQEAAIRRRLPNPKRHRKA
jgi:hypothetical protein